MHRLREEFVVPIEVYRAHSSVVLAQLRSTDLGFSASR